MTEPTFEEKFPSLKGLADPKPTPRQIENCAEGCCTRDVRFIEDVDVERYTTDNAILERDYVKKGDVERESITCPFCQEEDFDNEGIQIHFSHNYCDKFKADYISKEKVREALLEEIPYGDHNSIRLAISKRVGL